MYIRRTKRAGRETQRGRSSIRALPITHNPAPIPTYPGCSASNRLSNKPASAKQTAPLQRGPIHAGQHPPPAHVVPATTDALQPAASCSTKLLFFVIISSFKIPVELAIPAAAAAASCCIKRTAARPPLHSLLSAHQLSFQLHMAGKLLLSLTLARNLLH